MAPKMGPTIPQHATRESWLVAAAELLRPDVEMAVCEHVTGRLNAEAIPQLGSYPHQKWNPQAQRKKQGTRLRLWICECPVKVRVASDTFDATCNICDARFQKQGNDESDEGSE